MSGDAALTRGLALLADALGDPDVDLATEVDTLACHVSRVVDSYVGLRVSIALAHHPVHLTVFVATAVDVTVRTSLWFAVPGTGGRPSGVALTLLAGRSGAFVDLGADVAFGFGLHRDDVVLDRHLATTGSRDLVAGLAEQMSVERAVGVLVDRGLLPDAARAWLSTTAATANTSVGAAAIELLATRGWV